MKMNDWNNEDNEFRVAVGDGNVEKVRALIDAGADVKEHCNINGDTALIIAAMSPYPEMVRLLLEKGAHINACDNYGCSALRLAVPKAIWARRSDDVNERADADKRMEIVRILLDAGADFLLRDDEGGTPLSTAAKYEDLEVLRLMLAADDARRQS